MVAVVAVVLVTHSMPVVILTLKAMVAEVLVEGVEGVEREVLEAGSSSSLLRRSRIVPQSLVLETLVQEALQVVVAVMPSVPTIPTVVMVLEVLVPEVAEAEEREDQYFYKHLL